MASMTDQLDIPENPEEGFSPSEHSQCYSDMSDAEVQEPAGSPDFYSAKTSMASTPTTDYFPDSEEELYDDEPSDLPAIPINYNRGRRTSVSAESMAPSQDKDYVKIYIPKTPEQRKRIEASIANNFLFKNLDEEQYKDVIDAMVEKKVEKNEEIISQGGIGDFFYVVETGTFDVYVSKNGTAPELVHHYESGGSFGELALMYNAPRAATVIATSDAVLWALDRVTFRRILMENTSRKRRMYESFLEEVPILVSLEPYERHKIADALESLYYEDNQLVIKQGDIGNSFYLIESGEARVTKVDEDGVEHELPGLNKGEYFGELALLNNKPRAVNIRAKGRLKVATLGKKAFVRLLGPVVDILKRNSDNYETITRSVQQC
ncbi:8617_t:CDS:2 [Cetraspora pellucida]|uniref:8617_t:CDS:1 n=1 Tax=Cetraspora pellucida TaxID=1433469 RepID=A0ACA9LQT4_9GLOM|nr:8617_t:CDS:2 [Cetraspora pellucida]